ncbi:MAG: hypothetical protein R2707_18950 [Acidimicrobiales bacterium]
MRGLSITTLRAGERNAIPVPDSDELFAEDIDVLRRGGARFVPRSAWQQRGATGLVLLSRPSRPSVIFLTRGRLPVRADLPHPGAHRLAERVRIALGDRPGRTTGPLIDDPRWRGIGVAREDDSVRLRLHTDAFDRTVVLDPDAARLLADLLGDL